MSILSFTLEFKEAIIATFVIAVLAAYSMRL